MRMVAKGSGEHEPEWAAIRSIAQKIGCVAETLGRWARQVQRNAGRRPGAKSVGLERLKELERENRELWRANETLRRRRCSSRRRSYRESSGRPGGAGLMRGRLIA